MLFRWLRRWFYRQFDLQFSSYVKGQLDGLEARLGAKIDKLARRVEEIAAGNGHV